MLLSAATVVAADEETPASTELAALLQRRGLPLDGVSVYAHDTATGAPLIALAADVPRNPASTMKLLTTLVGLEELGPAYIWKTEAYSLGSLRDGRLQGDLYLKGYGDPYLVTESFWGLLNGLRQMGVRAIDGDLVLDGSYVQPDANDPADFDGQKLRAYNAPAAALLVNFQTVQLRFIPQPLKRRLTVIADPHPDNLIIDNKLKLTGGFCRNWSSHVRLQVVHGSLRTTLRLTGRYPTACGEHELYRVISDAPQHIFGVFKSLWTQLGGSIGGGLREAVLPPEAQRLHAVDSKPLADILRGINKYSNNVMTRQLVLTLGAERAQPPGTTDKGLGVIRRWLTAAKLEFPELILENGVGLSRVEQISARHLGAILQHGFTSRYMPEYLSSLPIAGIDGTLQRRFGASELSGRLHAKTGSLDNVRTLAGYLLDHRGRRIVVVIFHNHANADTAVGERIQEAVLEWLYRRP